MSAKARRFVRQVVRGKLEVGCGNQQPKISKEGLGMNAEFARGITESAIAKKRPLLADEVFQILKKISDEDIRKMGLDPERARPDWMIITVLPVPPPHVRPSVAMGDTDSAEDDLTHKIGDIVKANAQVRQQEQNGAPASVVQDLATLLQFHVATYFNNTIPGQPPSTLRNGRSLKSITQRLEGKSGRLRGNLMGKRVDFSARTVITPDPILSIDQVGVPRTVAMNLTYPEIVTPFNIDRLTDMVNNGPDTHPGAKYIIRTDGVRFDIRRMRKAADRYLEFGYRVERHLLDGDVVIFNRQPSLHKMSMMGHRIKIMPYSTFRLNLSCTTPYNADFDGDEMNLHVPQSLETRAEVLELMMVPRQVVAANANKPVMGIVQDTLVGSRLMTKRDTFLEKDLLMNTIMWLKAFDGKIPIPTILKPKPLWTGKQVFSLFLPNVNLEREANLHDGDKDPNPNSFADTRVIIQQGELLAGILDKKSLGNVSGSIIHTVWLEHGPEATRNFMDQTQLLVNYWLLQRGFTVGIGDTVADDKTMFDIKIIIDQQKALCDSVILDDQRNRLDKKPGRTMEESFEQRVGEILNKARDDAGKAAEKSLDESNNVKQMVIAGSKGSSNNISQMIACVGQQNVEGKRIPYGFRNRTLPHYPKMDVGAESRGFVENSYLRGLEPQEFFFHAMGGREGLIDTAVKTSETGYIQRRLVKSMEDLAVNYDSTVRNSQGYIIQFLYGEDGMDGQRIESQQLNTLNMTDAAFRQAYQMDPDDSQFGEGWLDEDIRKEIRSSPKSRDALAEEFEKLSADREWLRNPTSGTNVGFWKTLMEHLTPNATKHKDGWNLPVNLSRLITNAQRIFKLDPRSPSNLHPVQVVEMLDALTDSLRVVEGDDVFSRRAIDNATRLFKVLLRSTLASKRVIKEWRLNTEAFDWVLGEVQTRFRQALVQPGEMVCEVFAHSPGWFASSAVYR
jgi:DNA-directed RNA polymerase II subunit RPB1